MSEVLGLRVADLELWLDARESGVSLALPACHTPFQVARGHGEGLRLEIRSGPLQSTASWRSLFHDDQSWHLWRDSAGRRVFVPSRHSPPRRQIAVDTAFHRGEVVGEFGANGAIGQPVYPLDDIDMVLYANWLAETGDVIVHAAGIDDEGAGYAFAGPSGAGKSTLVSELASHSVVRVLGEDQVILRLLAGEFVIYGTPWHTDPARCSPDGVPLRKLFFLDRANGHGAAPCGPRAGIELLLQNALTPYYNRAGVERILDNLSRLAEQVRFYTIGFQMGADVMALIREA